MPDLLDSQIRDLVARAVNDAPPAPDIDTMLHHVSVSTRQNPRRSRPQRWVTYGAAGLAAAAAAVGLVVISLRDIEPTVAPQTTPSVVTTVTPPTAQTSPTTEPVDATVAPSTTPETAPSSPPSSQPAPAAQGSWLAVAGPNGVTLTDQDGNESVVTTEPMGVAVPAPNGSVYMQRLAAAEPTTSNPILSASPETGALDPVAVPAELADSALALRDVAQSPDGPPVLLVEVLAPNCTSPESCDNPLYLFSPGGEQATKVGVASQWEYSVNNISYGSSGLVVSEGSYVGSDLYSLSAALDISPIDGAAFGVTPCDDGYANCSRVYTIDTIGANVAWINIADGADPELVVHQTGGRGKPVGRPARVSLKDYLVGYGNGSSQADQLTGLNIADIRFDPSSGELIGGRMVAWWGGDETSNEPPTAVVVDLGTGTASAPITGRPALN
jgi:hypothetical protein